MRGSSRYLLVAAALCALAWTAPAALAAKSKVKILGDGQAAILSSGAIKAKVSVATRRGRSVAVAVNGRSATFDHPRFTALTETRTLRFHHSGSKTVKLALSAAGKRQIDSCEARTLRVRAGTGSDSANLVRQTPSCKPKPIDLSHASKCDFIGQQSGSLCMLPFPDDFYTVKDPSSNTGRRIAFKSDAMPANASNVRVDPTPYARNDGFSPGQTIVLRVPGLDSPTALAKTNAVPINHLGRYTDRNTPVVVIDANTGKRWPIWVEIDSNASSPDDTALLIHPAKNFNAKHRYIVALRNLKDSSGKAIAAPEGFRYYRDDLPSNKAAINKQRGRFERVFRDLRSAGIQRANLYLAWDFTVGSDLNIASRMLDIRNDAFAQLGDTDLSDGVVTGTAPTFNVDQRRPRSRFRPRPPGDRDLHGALLHDHGQRRALRPGQRLQPRLKRQAEAERHLDGQLHLHRPALDRR